MYGWRSRIGALITETNTVVESEFHPALPTGVSLHTARMSKEGETKSEELDSLTKELERGASVLSSVEVDIVAFGCTSGSFLKGAGYEEEIERNIEDVAGVPAVATAASVRRAINALGLESLAVTSVYVPEINERLASFLKDSGYEVTDISGLGSSYGHDKIPPESTYQEAKKLDHADADGIFISCTNYRTFEVIERLESDLGKPVVTSNQATLWDALRTGGVDYTDIDLGTLFDEDR